MAADVADPPRDSLPEWAADLSDLLVRIDPNGRIVFVSASVTALAGYEAADLVGRTALDLLVAKDRSRALRHYLRLRRGPAPAKSLTVRARHKAGQAVWLEGRPTAVRAAETETSGGWIDVLRPIEDRGPREDELRATARRAEAKADDQAEFLANMSHEIRTPLNSIIGFMQVLKRDGHLGETQIDYVSRVEDAGRNLLVVVNDALDLAKIESGTMRLDRRAFSPQALIADAVALVRPQAAEKGLTLEADFGTDPPPVVGDPDRLRQILLNLLSNAIKFTVRGGVELRLEGRRSGQVLGLAFVIKDSGMGIAPDQMPRLFRRFTQADRSIARRFGGTGLGLAISKRLIEAMGGSIEAESTLGAGSTFTVRLMLPLAEPRPVAAIHAGARRLLAPARHDTLRERRILVADDVPINQKLVEAMLTPLGCRIDMVADGAEALRAVQSVDYSLVLMDMQMPRLDGVSATLAIRALGGRFLDLPIIALTANVFPEETRRAKDAGMNDVVVKPIDSGRLTSMVVEWVTRHHPPTEPKAAVDPSTVPRRPAEPG